MADKKKRIKKYKPKKDKLVERTYFVKIETMGDRPDQLERVDKVVRREIHFAFGSSATVFLVEGTESHEWTLLKYDGKDHL